ncbi:MAG: hypothetical protein Alpg2KO_00470 [Alphaproteobacteria bacterium]
MSTNRMEQGGDQWTIEGELNFTEGATVNGLPLAAFDKSAGANPVAEDALGRDTLGNIVQGRRNLATAVGAHYVIDTLADDAGRIASVGVGQAVFIRGAAVSEGGWTLDTESAIGGLYAYAGVPNTLHHVDQYHGVPGMTVTELTTGIQWSALSDGASLTWVSNVYYHVLRLAPWTFREWGDQLAPLPETPDGTFLGADGTPDIARLFGSAPGAVSVTERAEIAVPVPGNYVAGEKIKLAATVSLTGSMEVGGSAQLVLERYPVDSQTADALADETVALTTTPTEHEFEIDAPDLKPGELLYLLVTLTADNSGGLASPDRAVASNITLSFSSLR